MRSDWKRRKPGRSGGRSRVLMQVTAEPDGLVIQFGPPLGTILNEICARDKQSVQRLLECAVLSLDRWIASPLLTHLQAGISTRSKDTGDDTEKRS